MKKKTRILFLVFVLIIFVQIARGEPENILSAKKHLETIPAKTCFAPKHILKYNDTYNNKACVVKIQLDSELANKKKSDSDKDLNNIAEYLLKYFNSIGLNSYVFNPNYHKSNISIFVSKKSAKEVKDLIKNSNLYTANGLLSVPCEYEETSKNRNLGLICQVNLSSVVDNTDLEYMLEQSFKNVKNRIDMYQISDQAALIGEFNRIRIKFVQKDKIKLFPLKNIFGIHHVLDNSLKPSLLKPISHNKEAIIQKSTGRGMQKYWIKYDKTTQIKDSDIQFVEIVPDSYVGGIPDISIKLNKGGTIKLADLTKKYINEQVAFIINGKLITVRMITGVMKKGLFKIYTRDLYTFNEICKQAFKLRAYAFLSGFQ